MALPKKKILVVDDSALMRRVLCDIIESDDRFEVAGKAVNGLEAFDLNCREMDKHIIAAVVVGNEAVALFSIEPLHCSGVHSGYLLQKFRTRKKYKV